MFKSAVEMTDVRRYSYVRDLVVKEWVRDWTTLESLFLRARFLETGSDALTLAQMPKE